VLATALRRRVEAGEDPTALVVDAFALTREAARRALGERPYDEQLLAGIGLHDGKVVEMQTGDELKGLQFCITGLEGYGWLADFGERTFGTVLFLFNDEFFGYQIMMPEDGFSFVRATMERSLGAPTQSQPSTVHNRMGAEFDQLTLLWRLPEVDVVLTKRGDSGRRSS
jgi:SecA-like ATPase subunit of protein translocation complex